MSEPSEHLDRQFDKPHRQICNPRKAHATRTQATQHRSAIETEKHSPNPVQYLSLLITSKLKKLKKIKKNPL